eukprot:4023537-Amphidinium_carterae.1
MGMAVLAGTWCTTRRHHPISSARAIKYFPRPDTSCPVFARHTERWQHHLTICRHTPVSRAMMPVTWFCLFAKAQPLALKLCQRTSDKLATEIVNDVGCGYHTREENKDEAENPRHFSGVERRQITNKLGLSFFSSESVVSNKE